MRSFTRGKYHVAYNGDFSGKIRIADAESEVWIPFELLEEVVGRKYQSEAITYAESLSGSEFLNRISEMS